MTDKSISNQSQDERHILLTYVADLEMEVDRLRKAAQILQCEAGETVRKLQGLEVSAPENCSGITEIVREFAAVLSDLSEQPEFTAAHDHVIAIPIKPLIEQVFRWQQRVWSARDVSLHMSLECEDVEWFPSRLRHILDNLISNSIRFRDTDKGESRVTVAVRSTFDGYELRVCDNGSGIEKDCQAIQELFYRTAPSRAAGLGVGLHVVTMLVENSGGAIAVQSDDNLGTAFVVTLPRYQMHDFLESSAPAT